MTFADKRLEDHMSPRAFFKPETSKFSVIMHQLKSIFMMEMGTRFILG